MAQRQRKKSKWHRWRAWLKVPRNARKVFGTVLVTLTCTAVGAWFSLDEPRLGVPNEQGSVQIGPRSEAIVGDSIAYFVEFDVLVFNHGFRAGFVNKCEVPSLGLSYMP